jgi:hypothetical protein
VEEDLATVEIMVKAKLQQSFRVIHEERE